MKKEMMISDFSLCLFSQLMVKTEQVAGNISDNFYLVDDFTGMFFFFHLLIDKPLEHFKCCMIFLPDGKIHKPVDHGSDLLLMGVHFVEYLAGRRPFCFRCFDIKETGFTTSGDNKVQNIFLTCSFFQKHLDRCIRIRLHRTLDQLGHKDKEQLEQDSSTDEFPAELGLFYKPDPGLKCITSCLDQMRRFGRFKIIQ